VDEGGEQETVIRNRIVIGETDSSVECPACRTANRGDSKFCKSCGGPLAPGNQPSPAGNAPYGFNPPPPRPPQNVYEDTTALPPPVFTPPGSPGYQTGSGKKRQNNILVAAVVAAVVAGTIIAGAIIYTSQSGSKPSGTPTPTASKPSPSPTAATPRPTATATAPPAAGKTGHLTTNQRIRSDSNRVAEILGVHYRGAKVEILDEITYTTEDGTPATWYRVRVLEDGCDMENKRGCGNNLDEVPGQAAREGWMNAKFIALD
jgi:hypothetical protein